LPTIIAGYRIHPNTAAVAVLKFLLGWTGLGWGAALAWSFAKSHRL
jgi:Superinfection immunity protein